MNTKIKSIFVLALVLLSAAFSVHGLIPDDADGDGVPDSEDLCPTEDASGFDRNADGCIDAFVGARHIEYWSTEDATISYVINEQGVPSITNGSDLTAVQDAVDSWMGMADTELNFVFGGTTTQTNSNGLDRVNLVTFVDNAFPFSSLVLAVGLSTSFEADTLIDGRIYQKGEIFDADMVFNPTKTFQVGNSGTGVDVQSVATHEAGHLFGISHSAIQSSTMFYVLPGGLDARSLETDDELVYFKAYGEPAALTSSNRIDVVVQDGETNDPVPGAIVFVIDAATDETVACDYTLANGEATFPGLPNGSYFVSIHPLNGTAPIGFIAPGNINALIAEIAVDNFGPESFDGAESNQDDPAARTAVTVGVAAPVASVGIITNIDVTPPTVVSASPEDGTIDVAIDGAYRVQFSEAIDISTLAAAFSFRDDATGTPQPGSLAILLDDSVVVYIPSPPLTFSTDYTLSFDEDLTDKEGNALATEFTLGVTTEAEPPISLSSLAPSKGVLGATVIINGQGFEAGATVDFAGLPATVTSLTDRRIVTSVPGGAATGLVTVRNPDLSTSNSLTFTVLTQAEVARGWESGQVTFGSRPRAIAVTPDGAYAYVATDDGCEAIVVDPSITGYLVGKPIPAAQGFDDVAVTPSGTRAYAVSEDAKTFVEIMSDPTTGLLFNTILSTRGVGAGPRGIVIDPTGDRAYVATDEAEVQVWDIRLGSPTYRQHIGTILSPGGIGVVGAMAMTPSGDRLLFASDDGNLLFYDPATQAIVSNISVGLDVRGMVVDPLGERAYVTHDDGDISVVNVQGNPFEVQDIVSGGSLRGLAMTPGASYLYSSDRALDDLKVVDLVATNATFRSVVGEIPAAVDPVDVATSPDGFYAFSVLQGDASGNEPRMLVSTIGVGPTLRNIHPIAGQPGTIVVLSGADFGEGTDAIAVNFNGIVVPELGVSLNVELVVAVPAGATSGPVTVEVEKPDGSLQISNPLSFQVLTPSSGGLRFAGTLEPNTSTGEQMEDDIVMSPKGDIIFARFDSQTVQAYDIRPSSINFHNSIRSFSLGTIVDMEITADGKTVFFYTFGVGGGNQLLALVSDPNDPNFAKLRPVSVTGFGAGGGFVRTSPNNIHVLVYDNELNDINLIDATDVSLNVNPLLLGPSFTPAGGPRDLVFHPSGRAAYVLVDNPAGIQVLNLDLLSLGFGTAIQFIPVASSGVPVTMSIDATPDGSTVYVYTIDAGPGTPRQVHEYIVDPALSYQLGFISATPLGSEIPASFTSRDLRISPRGDYAIRSSIDGFLLYDVSTPQTLITPTVGQEDNLQHNDFAFTPDGLHMYTATFFHDHIRAYDFATTASIGIVSGNSQTGVVGEELAAPIRVRVTDAVGGPVAQGVPGVPVTFIGDVSNGFFEVDCPGGGVCLRAEVILPTDANGFAEARWRLLGTPGAKQVEATAEGVPGSPVIFTATGVAEPTSLPLTVAEVIPLDTSTDVSVSTAALVTFSREVDISTIDPTSLFIQTAAEATLIPVAYGFTSDNSRISLTPLLPLAPSTDYQIVSTAGIEAASGGGPLTNPLTTAFETQAPPPLAIQSIFPPSALPGTSITIAGSGFAVSNTVNFGATSVPGTGNSVVISAIVPAGATPGTVNVTVNNGTTTSNAVPFNILQASTTVIDDVISSIAAGSTKSVVISADGALCYAVGTEGDVVIPVGIEDEFTHPSIPVGDQPVAIVINPGGDLAYVANFNSGNVSVIDVDPASPTFHTVVETIVVGINPIDVAIAPDGGRLAVANAGSNDVSIVDTDETSATFNEVVSSVSAGGSTKSVVISADGTLYVGTSTGVLVIDASNNVVASVASGSTKSVVISADGTILFVLTTDNVVQIIDIQDGSPSENQVVSSVGAGGSAKSIVISADGTLLYIVQEGTDEVIVLAIEVIPGVGAIDPDAASSFTIQTREVGRLQTGDDPADIAVDPSGSGRVIVANAGDGTLTVFGPSFEAIPATFNIVPGIIIPKLPGFYVLGVIQLASPFSVHDIDIASVRVFDTVHVAPGKFFIGDVNFDDVDDLSVLFCRDEFLAAMPENGEHVDVTVKGLVGGEEFEGTDGIRVLRPTITKPEENEHLVGGNPYTLRWTTPLQILPCDQVKIEWRQNGDDPDDIDCDHPFANGDEELNGDAFSGVNEMEQLQRLNESADVADDDWILIANHVANDGDYVWDVPAGYYPDARLRITLLWFGFKVGSSEVPFIIDMTVPVRMKSFDVTMEDGTAVLRWETTLEVGMEGYEVVRSERETSGYQEITNEMIPSSGSTSGGSYEYRDESVSANRTYWYKLREVSEDRLGAEYGPYAVTYRLANQLDQNVPNPFNPTTTIKYAIAGDNPVSLVIYDVAGRKVRTLVNERQRADVYRVVWDGVNDAGVKAASGVYFYKLAAGKFTQTKKMVLLK